LAQKIIKLTKSASTLVYKPLPQDDPKQRKPDITLAKRFLKWQPKILLNPNSNWFIRE
jgi:UDP-glucuronate decarboxylase